MTIYSKYLKRILDFSLSLCTFIILSPLLLIIAILIRLKLGSPVLFRQARPGKDEKIFQLYKFRSMTNELGEDGRLLPDSMRLTKFGKFLRSSSIDELPELFNIIRGDMAIVGPRPLSIFYLPHYSVKQKKRHSVRPGLTGLAQVNGRNNLTWEKRFQMDVTYAENISFCGDVKIIFQTIAKVVRRSDIVVRGKNNIIDFGPYSILEEERDGGAQLADMTYSEIGSYFWLDGKKKQSGSEIINWLPSTEDSSFTFSGRNAIDIAIRDILKKHRIDRVLVPSYCCISMLQAFIDRSMKVEFYEVDYANGEFSYQIKDANAHTVVLVMSYFGLNTTAAHKAIELLHKKGAVVIEDITHSLFNNSQVSELSDYFVVSLRKWFAVPAGGWVGKRHGTLFEKPDLDSNHAVEEKTAAMREKYDYLCGKIDSKEGFLLAHAKFENDLIHVDRLLKIDDTSFGIISSTDVVALIKKRRRNAATLIAGLKDLEGTLMKIPKLNLKTDTPLFLPIFMKTEDRDALRKYLIEQGIYCPVHWPEVMGATVGIRANQLSLICDQRYSEGDMQAIVDVIHTWFRNRI